MCESTTTTTTTTQILPASVSELHPYVFLGEQLLLVLYWAITMDKSQGQTIKKAVIYLGKSEATARLAFGCLSRAQATRRPSGGAHALRQAFQAWRQIYSKD